MSGINKKIHLSQGRLPSKKSMLETVNVGQNSRLLCSHFFNS